MERLGANASARHALQYWSSLSSAARFDSHAFDSLWDDWSTPPPTDSFGRDTTTNELATSKINFLTHKLDNLLYGRYKSNFALQNLSIIGDDLPNSASLHTETWRSLLIASEGTIPDFSFMTLIREKSESMFYMDEEECCGGMLIVPRAQFYFIEIGECSRLCDLSC